MGNNIKSIQELSVLIVGFGSIGSRHYDNLRMLGLTKLGIMRTSNLKPHSQLEHSDTLLYQDYEKALEYSYDVVLICNPTSLHMEYALQAAKHKSHVFIEKPLSNNLNHIPEILALIDKHNLKIGIGYQMRFHPNLIDIKKWLNKQSIGDIIYVNVNAGEYLPLWHPWENHETSYASRRELGGGVALTQIHDVDYLTWMFGKLDLMHAHGGNSGVLNTNVEDYISATLKTCGNAIVHVHLDYLQNPPNRTMRIIGQNGSIEWDYYQNTAKLTISGKIEEISKVDPAWERNTMFVEEITDFLYAVTNNNEPKANIHNSLQGLETTLSITKYITSK